MPLCVQCARICQTESVVDPQLGGQSYQQPLASSAAAAAAALFQQQQQYSQSMPLDQYGGASGLMRLGM